MHVLMVMILRRLILGVLMLFAISVIIFFSVNLLPGDIAHALLGPEATPELIAAFRRELKLDLPVYVRYFEWAHDILRADLGRSLVNQREISVIISERLGNTIFLAVTAAVISVPLALCLGIFSALYRGAAFDRIVNVVCLSFASFPEFLTGYILIFLLAIKLDALPSLAEVNPRFSLLTSIYYILLPAFTLSLGVTGYMTRMIRAAIVNVLSSPYIEMAVISGVRPSRIIARHALPNAIAPVINVIVLCLAYLLVGVVIVEVVFVYPGLGQLLIDSVSKRDLPMVQVTSLIFASAYIGLNLVADVISIAMNPRLLHPR